MKWHEVVTNFFNTHELKEDAKVYVSGMLYKVFKCEVYKRADVFTILVYYQIRENSLLETIAVPKRDLKDCLDTLKNGYRKK